MTDELSITSVGAVSENTVTSTPTSDTIKTELVPKDALETLNDVQMSLLVANNLDVNITNCLKSLSLPRTEENYNKIAVNLNRKIEEWLVSGEDFTAPVDSKDYAKHFFDTACSRMGVESTVENWRTVLKKLGKVK